MHVKVCGIRREEDAVLVADLGADAIGLLVGQQHSSPDFISEQSAAGIARILPSKTKAVLVTHVPDVDEIERLLRETEIAMLLLHSEILLDEIQKLKVNLSKLTV